MNELDSAGRTNSVSWLDFLDWRAQAKAFAGMSAIDNANVNLTGGTEPERLNAARVSANFWTLLGVRPVIGRGFAHSSIARPGPSRCIARR